MSAEGLCERAATERISAKPACRFSTAQKALSRYPPMAFNILLAFAAIHVAVNLFYQFVKKDPIIKAMITGRKPVEPFEDQAEMRPAPAGAAKALLCLAAATVLVLGGIKLFGGT